MHTLILVACVFACASAAAFPDPSSTTESPPAVEYAMGFEATPEQIEEIRSKGRVFTFDANEDIPDAYDHREQGHVTPVKSQGYCGSCWAFSATGTLESQVLIKFGKTVSLSEQNLVDCVTADNGCHGGRPSDAFNYVKNNGGLDSEESYPYVAEQESQCEFVPSAVEVDDSGYFVVPRGDEEALKAAVYTYGPVSVAISATSNFHKYAGGVFYDETCATAHINHAVVVVGYGSDSDGDYWIVKNSWGTGWGEDGYIRMARNRDNNCYIASVAIGPNVTSALVDHQMHRRIDTTTEAKPAAKYATGFRATPEQIGAVRAKGRVFTVSANEEIPAAYDHRDQGHVTPIKNQGHCESCWAFSATGTLESQVLIKFGKNVSLSEQNLVDCVTEDRGCHGGLPSDAFDYVKNNGGLDSEDSYPYEAKQESECEFVPSAVEVDDSGYFVIPAGDEEALKAAVYTYGPVSVAIVTTPKFQNYVGGYFYDEECEGKQMDHAVIVVGYGSDSDGDYWIVKNSWGPTWGEEGYVRMARNRDNHCQIASLAIGPNVTSTLVDHHMRRRIDTTTEVKPAVKHALGFRATPEQIAAARSKGRAFTVNANEDIPDAYDHRDQGHVTPVKNQGQCGSCWAFSATGTLESQVLIKFGKNVSLSEQNLVDCVTEDRGCHGGLPSDAFDYVQSNGGLDSDESYPYVAEQDPDCEFVPSAVEVDDSGYFVVPEGDEEALKAAVYTYGPVSVAVVVTDNFQNYEGGYFYDEDCEGKQMDHAVLVVGYGSDSDGDYWIVKNSWGPDWGEDGYIRMARNRDNNCQIASLATGPNVTSTLIDHRMRRRLFPTTTSATTDQILID